MFTYTEAISASDMATAVAPMVARIPPYTIDAGPPLSMANWKVMATVSQAHCTIISKFITEERLMCLYVEVSIRHEHRSPIALGPSYVVTSKVTYL
jgi:hypothetical protein